MTINKKTIQTAIKKYLKEHFGESADKYSDKKLEELQKRSALSYLWHSSHGVEGYLRAHKILKILKLLDDCKNAQKSLLLLTLAIMDNYGLFCPKGLVLANEVAKAIGFEPLLSSITGGHGAGCGKNYPSDNAAKELRTTLMFNPHDLQQKRIEDICKKIQNALNDKTITPEDIVDLQSIVIPEVPSKGNVIELDGM